MHTEDVDKTFELSRMTNDDGMASPLNMPCVIIGLNTWIFMFQMGLGA